MAHYFWTPLSLFSFAAALIASSCVSAAPRETMAERAHTAARHIEKDVDPNGPGVAYAIVAGGETIAVGGAGLADIEWGVSMTEQTASRLGSISKSLTAVAVLELAEKGVLDIDAPIERYAPQLPPQFADVTLRQLLSHRSGLPDHAFDKSLIEFIWFPMTTDKIIELSAHKPKTAPPGEIYEYVNFNYVLIAHVIEKATGKTFVDFAETEIFAANGMTGSGYDERARIFPRRARFYEERDGAYLNAAPLEMSHVSAAGALLATASDMAKWMQMLMRGERLSNATRAELWTPAAMPNGDPTSYGLGFNVESLNGEQYIWHSGLTPGAQAAFGMIPDRQIAVIVLANGFNTAETGTLMDEAIAILMDGASTEDRPD